MKRQILYTIAGFIALLMIISTAFAAGEYWACFGKNEKIDYCNPKTPDRTCDIKTGCTYCMAKYDATAQCYVQGSYPKCLQLPPSQCTYNNNGTIDTSPPVLTINKPDNNLISMTKSVLFDLKADKTCTFYYAQNANGDERWMKIATNTNSVSKGVTLKEGVNDLLIKAVASNGIEDKKSVKVTIDSIKPKITKTITTKGFANGKFQVLFTELNAKTLTLTYGNDLVGRKTANLDLSKCTDLGKGKYNCSITVSLNEYNNQEIDYKFKLTDIANSYTETKPIKLKVDISNPIINNPATLYKQDGKYILFNISVNEPNLLSIRYSDNDKKFLKLCPTLKNGYCSKKVSFGKGSHSVILMIDDRAGNYATFTLPDFEVI